MRHNKVSWHGGRKGHAGSWRFSKTVNKKRLWFYAPASIGPNSRTEADRWMHGVLSDLEAKKVDLGRLTVDRLREQWLEWLAGRVAQGAAAEYTLACHRGESRAVCRIVGPKVASTLTLADTDAMSSAWSNKSPSTVRNRFNALKVMIRWAVKRGLIPADPIPNLELPSLPYRGDRYAEIREVDDFLAWMELREAVGSSRVDLQACKLEYSIVSPK